LLETIQTIIMLLFFIVLSNILYKYIPRVSVPIFQILLGFLLGISPFGVNLHIETEIFMLVFIAPILFMDGKYISNRELLAFKKPILLMAFGLVLSTVFICGYSIYWLIPGLPLAASFALAAVLSPTDAVSVKALSQKIRLPHSVSTVVEGESLLNDVSGLIAFNFAIAAQLTGAFSIGGATLTFIYMAIGGAILGALASYFIAVFNSKLKRMGIEDAALFTLVQIMTPFVVFLLAEKLGFSGILAVVICGIISSLRLPKKISARETNIRLVSESTWSTFLLILNGLVFLLFGMQLPSTLGKIIMDSQISNITAIAYVLIITLILILFRFIWVYLINKEAPRARNALLTSLSGVRGAITLAACFSIPLTLYNGAPFPERDLILFISSGVIIMTLLIANIALPLICAKPDANHTQLITEARKKIMTSVIDFLENELNDQNQEAAYSLIAQYRRALFEEESSSNLRVIRLDYKDDADIIQLGLAAEKEELQRLLADKAFDEDVLHQIGHMLDLTLRRMEKNRRVPPRSPRQFRSFLHQRRYSKPDEWARAKTQMIYAAIKTITAMTTPENAIAVKRVVNHYMSIIDIFNQHLSGEKGKKYAQIKQDLEFKILQTQKDAVQTLLETGEISYATANKLKKDIQLEEVIAASELQLS
jgi:CPA1 family monovalent cation:H+ antiporter